MSSQTQRMTDACLALRVGQSIQRVAAGCGNLREVECWSTAVSGVTDGMD